MSAVRPVILVIDDEPQIHRFLSPALDAAGYEPRRADSGQEGLRGIALWAPDAVVLDLGLPDMDGKDVLTRAREFYAGPIIILSARDKEAEKIAALDLGANDYVEKPFGVGELLARLRVNLRQAAARPENTGPVVSGDVTIDLERRQVSRSGQPIRLTPKEYEVLARLARDAGKVIGHRDLLVAVWGAAHAEDTQYLRVV
ncbi:MAG: response regulator, partial [Brevundimonas sp.]